MKIIETERLLLRPITEDDAELFFEYCRNEHIGLNAGWKPHATIEETIEVIRAFYLDKENAFGIELKETGRLVGSIGLMPDPKRQNDRTHMLGYTIAEEYWGKGYATEAAHALVEFGFNELSLDLISAYCYPFNERSKRVLEKCGFSYEGRLRKAEIRFDGEVIDHECYSKVCTDRNNGE